MIQVSDAQPGARSARAWAAALVPAAAAAAAVLLLRGLVLWWAPYALIEDEAHYWEWSRRLGLSYATKGPGVAYAIAASTWVFGDTEFGVRLPAALAGFFGMLASAATAAAWAGAGRPSTRWAALAAALAYAFMPATFVLGLLMTIDGPLLASWAVAVLAAILAVGPRAGEGRPRWWAVCGLAVGVGFLFKYTSLLLVPGLIVFCLLARRRARAGGAEIVASAGPRALLRAAGVSGGLPRGSGRWALAGLAIMLACTAPVLVYNAQLGWPTLTHLLGHLGFGEYADRGASGDRAAGGWSYNPLWTLEFLGLTLALGGPAAVLGIAAVVRAFRGAGADDLSRGALLLVCAGVGPVAFYVLVTFFARAEANWGAAALVSVAPAAGLGAVMAYEARRRWLRFWANGAVLVGVVLIFVVVAGPVLAQRGVLTAVPWQRVIGVRETARAADEVLARLRRETGLEPVVISAHYGRASQMAFYLDGWPVTHAAAVFTGAEPRQYDLWAQTDLRRPAVVENLRGRPALLFGGDEAFWAAAFERVERLGQLPGEPKRDRESFVGYNFRGFAGARAQPTEPGSTDDDGAAPIGPGRENTR